MPQNQPPSVSPGPPPAQKTVPPVLWIVKLAIVVAIAGCLVTLIPAAINLFRERANRAGCANNLRQIGQALRRYANNNKCFPRTYYDPSQTTAIAPDFTGGRKTTPSSNPFLPQPLDSVGANNTLAAMFLLVRTVDLNKDVFICPSSNQEESFFTGDTVPTDKEVCNFAANTSVSYSFANPYPSTMAIQNGYTWSPNVRPNFAIAADRNDGFTGSNRAAVATLTSNSPRTRQSLANSRNHEQDGMHVLFNDGHVAWSPTMWAGAGRDSIYTAAKTTPLAGNSFGQADPAASLDTTTTDPQIDLDTVLLPKF